MCHVIQTFKETVMSYQIVNGIPRPVSKPLEKVDWNKLREAQANDPHHQNLKAGMSQKESFIKLLSK